MTDLYTFSFDALGTECLLHLYADSAEIADATAEAAMGEVYRIECRYSRYREDSVSLQSPDQRSGARG